MIKRCILSLMAFFSACFSEDDLQARSKDLSLLLETTLSEYNVPGMGALILTSDQILAYEVAGVRARNCKNKITKADLFHLGSDTKAMTAALLGMLVDKHFIHWNTKIVDVFPELKNTINLAYQQVTLKDLLTQRSGLAANLNYKTIQNKVGQDLVLGRHLTMVQALAKAPAAQKGEFLYSNLNFIIAGHMAEKVTGDSWEKLMTRYLFIPLKMRSAGFGPPSNGLVCTQPIGHKEKGQSVAGQFGDNPPLLGPAGTLHMTLPDWAKFIQMELKGAQHKPIMIKPETFAMLIKPVSNPQPSYAMGWGITKPKWANGIVLAHTGSNTYWIAKAWIVPNRDLAVLVTCNQGGKKADEACEKVGKKLLHWESFKSKLSKIDH